MKFDKKALTLYLVTDSENNDGESLYEKTELALKNGGTMVQLREKHLDKASFFEKALKFKKLCKKYDVPFIINDDAELAKMVDSDGVHIGQTDMDIETVKQIVGKNKIIGVSVQTVEQAEEAKSHGADYLGVGSVFETSTKPDAERVSIETLKEISCSVNIPVAAIGGINEENIMNLKNCNVNGIALVSAIYGADNVEKQTKIMKELAEEVIKK